MKGLTAVLLLSFAANLALAVLLLARRDPTRTGLATESAPTRAGTNAANPANDTTSSGAAAPFGHPADVAYVARLRAAGMPPDLINSLAYARVWSRYRDRHRALLPPDDDRYWLNWNQRGHAAASPETRAKLRELNQEMAAEMRALLGDGPDALLAHERRLYDQMADYLPIAKIQQIEAIRKDYDELTARVRDQARGLVLKADREQLRLIERERRADLAAVLTPEELVEYDLRASPTSNGLRHRLSYFEPSEDEFRAIARLQLAIDQQFGTANLSREEQERKQALEKQLPAQVQSVLSPERYADYLVTIDGMFSETRYFTNSYNLDLSVAKEIVALKQSTWKRIDQLDQAGLDAAQRAAALQALQLEVDHQLTARLGADIFAKYQKSGATSWMNRFRSRVVSPVPMP